MIWTLPAPLLPIANAIAVSPFAVMERGPRSSPRLLFEAFGTTLTIIALVWFAGTRSGIALWVREQRW